MDAKYASGPGGTGPAQDSPRSDGSTHERAGTSLRFARLSVNPMIIAVLEGTKGRVELRGAQ